MFVSTATGCRRIQIFNFQSAIFSRRDGAAVPQITDRTFPTAAVSRPTTIGCFVIAIVTRPAGIGDVPATAASLPTANDCFVSTTVTFPAAIDCATVTHESLPAGIDCLVLNTVSLPADAVSRKMTAETGKTAKNTQFLINYAELAAIRAE
jgi:hypothetical protein